MRSEAKANRSNTLTEEDEETKDIPKLIPVSEAGNDDTVKDFSSPQKRQRTHEQEAMLPLASDAYQQVKHLEKSAWTC